MAPMDRILIIAEKAAEESCCLRVSITPIFLVTCVEILWMRRCLKATVSDRCNAHHIPYQGERIPYEDKCFKGAYGSPVVDIFINYEGHTIIFMDEKHF